MRKSSDFESLFPALKSVAALLDNLPFPGAVIGGIAVGLQAVPRATKDIDAIILDELLQIERVADAALEFGFLRAPEIAIQSARRTRVLALEHGDTGIRADLLFGLFPFEERAAKSGQSMELDGASIKVCRPEDLLILKAFAGRPQDLADISQLLAVRKDIDRAYVEQSLRELAEQLESPEIWNRVQTDPSWAS